MQRYVPQDMSIQHFRRKVLLSRMLLVVIAFMAAFLFTSKLRSINQYTSSQHDRLAEVSTGQLSLQRLRSMRDSAFQKMKTIRVFSEESENPEPLMTHHPFDNKCKFPVPNIYAEDIIDETMSERLRKLKCPVKSYDYASLDSEGYLYVHPHFVHWPKLFYYAKCEIVIIDGGIRAPEKNMTKNTFLEIKTIEAPENERLWVNADAFIVRCYNHSNTANVSLIWEKPFAGMKDSRLPLNEVKKEKDLKSFGIYGNKLREEARKMAERYSIDILGIDSAARTMFMRHLPRTTETMHKLGFHFLYGYTKIADNSMVNLGPILVGDMKEALSKPKYDDSGDININWILPNHDKLDPTKLEFLWKFMKKEFGCETLFNEDISRKDLGLFNYPPEEFQGGFKVPPADHYYRAYYLAVYKNWYYEACKDGEQLQNEFIALWRRFAHRYRDVCHFGFTFVTTLSHESGIVLETIDEKISGHLTDMSVAGDLDNTFSIIMGDHGNRIGYIQLKYTGRIEERMPLMAIRLPNGFSEKYPKEYKNFLDNKNKLTSNFDIHRTLRDVVNMRFGDARGSPEEYQGRGISLFDEISNDRNCSDLFIPENFCMCMVDVSNVTSPLRNVKKIDDDVQKKNSFETLKKWLSEEKFGNCVNIDTLEAPKDLKIMAINQLSRFGLRTKKNVTVVAEARNSTLYLNFINHEFTVTGSYKNNETLKMLVRTEHFTERATNNLVFEPFVIDHPSKCSFVSFYDVCTCLGSA